MVTVFVLDDVALMKAEWTFHRHRVHLTDIDRAITGLCKILDPTIVPGLVISENAVGVRVDAREQRRPRWRAGR